MKTTNKIYSFWIWVALKMNTYNYQYYLPLLLVIALITCQNKTKTSGPDEVFALIQYLEGFDTLNCSRFGPVVCRRRRISKFMLLLAI